VHRDRHAPRRRPRAARSHRRRAARLQRGPRLHASRRVGDVGQPEALRHGRAPGGDGHWEFHADQKRRAEARPVASNGGMVAIVEFYRDNSRAIHKTLSILCGLVLWHYLATVVIADTAFLVSPLTVVSKAYEMLFVTGELYPHLFASSWIFLYGYL